MMPKFVSWNYVHLYGSALPVITTITFITAIMHYHILYAYQFSRYVNFKDVINLVIIFQRSPGHHILQISWEKVSLMKFDLERSVCCGIYHNSLLWQCRINWKVCLAQMRLVIKTCHHWLQLSNVVIHIYSALQLMQDKLLQWNFRMKILQMTSWLWKLQNLHPLNIQLL